jgi:hypothetical protein
MNEQARALLLAGVTLFGAGNGSGYLLGRTTAPAAPVAVKAGAPSPASAPPKVGDNSPAAPRPKAAAPSPRTVAAPRLKRPAPIVQERPQAKKKRTTTTTTPRPSGLPSCAVVRREYDSMNTAQRLAAYYRATAEQVAHGRRCLGI